MIWEVGQDCRLAPVTHGKDTHVKTCPNGEDSSLLVAIGRAIEGAGRTIARPARATVAPSPAAEGAGARGSSGDIDL